MENQERKKILILSPQNPLNPNGGAVLLKNRFDLLSKEYDLFMIAKDFNFGDYSNLKYFKKIKLIKKTKLSSLLLFLYRYLILNNIFNYYWIIKYRIKIIQIEFFDCLVYALFLFPLKLFGVKIFYTAHDIQTLYYQRNTLKYFFINKAEKILLKYFVDIIFVWGEDDKKELISWDIISDKIKIIHPTVVSDNKKKWYLNNITNFVFLGSYNHQPNKDSLNMIIKMWPIIKKHNPLSKLYLIIGRNIKLGLIDKSIVNCGFIENLESVLCNCNILLAPIISGTGVKVKIIEAFKFGIPVISTPLGFRNFDNLDKNNILVASSKDFLEKVVSIKHDDTNLVKISEYEKKYFVENFSEENINLYKEYYSECLKK